MKNTYRKPYIYKVTNLETHQYYIGSQCIGKIVGMNYFTSSYNKEFREDFKAHKEKYKIEIIKEFEEFVDPKECVRVENYIIRNHMQLKDGLCLNRSYHCNGEKVFSRVGTHHSEEAKHKMSMAHKGHPTWKKGMHHSEEAKQKMSIAHKIKISIEGMVFDSHKEASKYYNVSVPTIRYWVKTKKHNAFYIEKCPKI